MGDPLSVTAGVVAIITATIQSSRILYQTIQSFKDHPRSIRQLRDELEALDGVLRSLEAFSGSDLSIVVPLKLPLTQCAKACAEFQELIVKCTKHSGGQKNTSFRDWAKLKYMDNDVNGFTAMLSGYKSTIAIALADANLRSSAVTLQVLNEYKDMIRNTRRDLEDHLEETNARLQSLTPPSNNRFNLDPTDADRFKNERETTEQCLDICAEVLAHINELRFQPILARQSDSDQAPGLSTQDLTHAHIMTLSTLKECTDRLSDTLAQLRVHGEETQSRLSTGTSVQEPRSTPGNDARRLAREHDSVRQCLTVCSEADERASSGKVHVLDDITIGENGEQMLISSLGDLYDVRRVKLGDGAVQIVASTSEPAIQELFKTRNQR